MGFSGYRKTNFFRQCLDGLVSSSCLLVMSDCFKCCMHDWHSMKCLFQIKTKRSVYSCFAFLLVCGKPLVTLWTDLRGLSSITFGVCAVFGLTVFIFLPSSVDPVFLNLFLDAISGFFKVFFRIKYFFASFYGSDWWTILIKQLSTLQSSILCWTDPYQCFIMTSYLTSPRNTIPVFL